jgi:hypothetical protein
VAYAIFFKQVRKLLHKAVSGINGQRHDLRLRVQFRRVDENMTKPLCDPVIWCSEQVRKREVVVPPDLVPFQAATVPFCLF